MERQNLTSFSVKVHSYLACLSRLKQLNAAVVVLLMRFMAASSAGIARLGQALPVGGLSMWEVVYVLFTYVPTVQ